MNKERNNRKLLFAGFLAITANTLMLKTCVYIGIRAESGGLLKLLLGVTFAGKQPPPIFKSGVFWVLFHCFTGYLLVILYSIFFRRLRVSPWGRGILTGLAPWTVNGLIITPLLKQGVFGYRSLDTAGMVYFLAANLVFGLLISVMDQGFGYNRFNDRLYPQI